MRAWFAGDFDRTLALCDAIVHPVPWLRAKIAFLRARCYLRLNRAADARAAVLSAFVTYEGLDERCTAEMLLGAADVRLGDVDAGLARLSDAQAIAERYDAHIAVRSEIAMQRGLAFYARRDLAAADVALERADPSTDIIYAKALVYRGWVAIARPDYRDAQRLFLAALQHLARCRHADASLEANILQALASLASGMLDFACWQIVEQHAARLVWTDAMRDARFWVTSYAAILYEAAGATDRAYTAAAEAERLAPSEGLRIHALCRRAAIARWSGERFAHRAFAGDAHARLAGLDVAALTGDERIVPLLVAEELAHAGDVPAAQTVLATYAIRRPDERVLAMADDPRQLAYDDLVTATVARAAQLAGQREGEPAKRAHDFFAQSFRRYRAIGFRLRAAEAGLALGEITGQLAYYEAAESLSRPMSERSGLRRALGVHARIHRDALASRLTSSEREVASMIAQGRTNREIAAKRSVALQTVKNTVSSIFAKYDVGGRTEFVDKLQRAVAPHQERIRSS